MNNPKQKHEATGMLGATVSVAKMERESLVLLTFSRPLTDRGVGMSANEARSLAAELMDAASRADRGES